MQLIELGWDSFFDNAFEEYKNRDLVPARIARVNRTDYLAYGEKGGIRCEISGRYRYEAGSNGHFPTVGDWVAMALCSNESKAVINALLPRRSAFVRRTAGLKTEEQVIAANIDTVFIVCGLDGNYNLRRIERYLSLTWESGATPVVLLNKADLCAQIEECRNEVAEIAIGVPVHLISASQKLGLEVMAEYIRPGRTAAFLGSSGVGKSTIINSLAGSELLKVNEVSEMGSRGRHTTTHRELVLLPGGGMVIDTPGMREIQVWGDEEGLQQAFDDIEELATKCQFRDCRHLHEPGCAVQAAIGDGSLDSERLRSFLKLQKEFRYLAARQTMKARVIEKDRWKKISVVAKKQKKEGMR
jgi:ribosome biogenesis GTPase